LTNRLGSLWTVHDSIALVSFWPVNLALSEEDNVEERIVEAWRIKSLTFVEVNHNAVLEENLYGLDVELTKDRMKVVQAHMRNVHLYFILVS
jgi:hypothetical protein